MICLNSNVSAPSKSNLVKISIAANHFGVCQETLRRWEAAGHIRSYRANARSHRLYNLSEIAQHLGLDDHEEKGGTIAVGYCRTSSLSQVQSLQNQCERMTKEISKLERIPEKDVVLYQECKSSFSSREVLNKLCEDIISGHNGNGQKIVKVYVLWLDRLGRDGVLELFRSICRNRGVEICVIEQEECSDKGELQNGLIECLNYLQVICNRRAGARGGAKVKKTMDQNTLELVYSLYKEGQSIRQIEAELKRRKIKDNHGSWYKRGVILNRLNENLAALQTIKNDKPQNSCVEFLQKYVKKSRGKRSLARASIARAYSQFCLSEGKVEGSASHLTKSIDKVFPNLVRTKNKSREVFYQGLVLNTNKTRK